MNKINEQRTQRFIQTLNTNSKLTVAAMAKAHDMLTRSYFAHIDPDGNYVWPRIEAAGYVPYQTLGENLAMDFTSADGVINAWMNSPTHRANVVNEKFVNEERGKGVEIYEKNKNKIIVVIFFGTLFKPKKNPPLPPVPKFSPAAKAPPAP